jgi:hypothetical protein
MIKKEISKGRIKREVSKGKGLRKTVGLPLRERSEDTSSICDGTVAPLALTVGLPQVPPQAEQLLMTMSLT